MNIRDIVLIGLFSAIVTAGKLALSFIPNVEIVTLLFIIYTLSLGLRRSLLISIVFVTTEILLYGFSTWILGYYILWPMLIIITSIISRKFNSEYIYAAIAGVFGLTFGIYFSIIESFFYGWAYGLTYWVRGIPWDIVHGGANYVLTLTLLKPLTDILNIQMKRFKQV